MHPVEEPRGAPLTLQRQQSWTQWFDTQVEKLNDNLVTGCLFKQKDGSRKPVDGFRRPPPPPQADVLRVAAPPAVSEASSRQAASPEENAEEGRTAEKSQTWLEWVGGESYEEAWKAIIRPYRDIYQVAQLGPNKFSMKGHKCRRIDLKLTNVNGHTLECSHFVPGTDPKLSWPCVVYLHGNSSSRLEAHDVVKVCVPRNLGVFCFDFAGCGNSGGDYITLGHNESKDLAVVLAHLRQTGQVSAIGLWGRSMGAATAILAVGVDHNINACVLDSPFSRLRLVAEELLDSRLHIPKFILDLGIEAVRREVHNRAKFDMNEVVPANAAMYATCPAFFGASLDDELISSHHSQDLYECWGCPDREIRHFKGGHNDRRPEQWMMEAADWMKSMLATDPFAALPEEAHEVADEDAAVEKPREGNGPTVRDICLLDKFASLKMVTKPGQTQI